MKTRILSFMASAVAVVALLTGCSTENDFEDGKDGLASLELSSVNSADMLTRAVIDGTNFPTDKGNIGLFLYAKEDASEKYGDGYANVQYSYNSDKKKWTASPSIKVGSDPGYLYGYYPYKADTQEQPINVKAIPVTSSVNGDDVMYASKQVEPITDQTAANTSIKMNHALARVAIKVINNGYTGNAKLSKIKFSGAEIAPEGILNALDGSVTATKSDVTLDVTGDAQTITTAGTIYECLLVPSKAVESKQDVNLTLTIDGEDKTASLSDGNGVIFGSGVKSRIVINLSNSGISVASVSIDDWQTVEVGGHKVTVKLSDDEGIVKDVMVTAYIENKNVVVKTYSDSKKPLIIREEDGKLIVPVENGNKSTFTISDITSDITATLAYAKTFKVTQSFKADVTPVSGYFENYPAQGVGEVLEGRTTEVTVTVATNIPGYHFEKIVCDEMVETGNTIVLKNVSKNLEVVANYKFYDYPLPGVFTVADDGAGNVRKVQFARGNLWYQKGVFHNEDEQYTFSSSDWKEDGYISHFMWCKSASESVKKTYAEQGTTGSDILFTNAGPTEPNGNFAVNGQKGFWRALSGGGNGEWKYLIDRNGGTLYKLGVTVCGSKNCLILLPDDWKWDANTVGTKWQTEYSESTDVKWSTMEAAGAVCLPAAGFRYGYDGSTYVNNVGNSGHYWSSTPNDNINAYYLRLNSVDVDPARNYNRGDAYAVRLVTEVK